MTQAIRVCVIFLLLCLGDGEEIQKDKSLKINRSLLYPSWHTNSAQDIKTSVSLRLLSFCISLTGLHVDSLDYRVVAGVVKHLDGIRHYPQV